MDLRRDPNRILEIAAHLVAAVFIVTIAVACVSMLFHPGHVDFVSYWAAGRLALQGQASAAYDLSRHRAVELSAVPRVGLLPFPYPPAFLFAVAPFGLFPLWLSFTLWLLLTIGAYLASIRRFASPAIALAHPAVLSNGLIGQNGFLSSGLFAGGMSLLTGSPVTAGVLFGLLSYKPQLALLIPVALIAGREWKALAATVLSAATLWTAALAVFGPATYIGFARMVAHYSEFAAAGKWQWEELASPYAFLRYLGASQVDALAAHILLSCSAAALVCRLWWRRADGRVAALAAATLLISPYLFTYDALILMVTFGWLIERGCYLDLAISWILCLLPVSTSFGLYSGPNTVPFAAVICLGAVVRGHRPPDGQLTPLFSRPPPAAAS